MSAPLYVRHNGHNYVLASHMATQIKRAMEIARREGMMIEATSRAVAARIRVEEEPA